MYEYNYIMNVLDRTPKKVQRSGVQFWNALTSREYTKKEDCPLFIPALFDDTNQRKNDNTLSVTMIVVDIDGKDYKLPFPKPDFYVGDKKFQNQDFTFFAYSTFNHTQDLPKWRMIIPLLEPIPVDVWTNGGWEAAMYFFLITFFNDLAYADGATDYEFKKYIDSSCRNPSRAYYYPSHPIGGTPLRYQRIGKKIHPDDIMCYRALYQKTFKKRKYKPVIKTSNYSDNETKLKNSLRCNSDARKDFATRYGLHLRNQGSPSEAAIKWDCPNCGRSDTTYFYIEGSGAFCGHLNSCGWSGSLYELGCAWGWR